MADAQLDGERQSSGGRPQSTIARTFSQELMDIFRIEDTLSDLDQQVKQRRQNVGRNNQELAAIEARLRETEDRLRRSQHFGPALHARPAQPSPQNRPEASSSFAREEAKSRSRPGTARNTQQGPNPAYNPPTPGAKPGQ